MEGSSYTESKQKWGGGQSCNGGFLRSQNDFCKIQSAVIFNVRARRAREKFPYSTPSLILKIIRFFHIKSTFFFTFFPYFSKFTGREVHQPTDRA